MWVNIFVESNYFKHQNNKLCKLLFDHLLYLIIINPYHDFSLCAYNRRTFTSNSLQAENPNQ